MLDATADSLSLMLIESAKVRMATVGPHTRSLRGFRGENYDKGRNTAWQIAWFVTMRAVFSAWWLPRRVRPALLRLFGAQIGDNVVIRHDVKILWPWKLIIGDNSWIGEEVWILNLEQVTIGHDVCISQRAFLCTGSHSPSSPTFEFDNGPIVVGSHAWVAADVLVLRGVVVGDGAVLGARSTVTKTVGPAQSIAAASKW